MEQGKQLNQMSIKQSIDIEAPKQVVWEAITSDVSGWWGSPYLLNDESTEITIDAQLGGLVAESNGESRMAWGIVTGVCPAAYLEFTGAMGMDLGTHGQVSFELAKAGDGTRLTVRHEAIGPFGPGSQQAYSDGWADLLQRVRLLLEHHEEYGLRGRNTAPALV